MLDNNTYIHMYKVQNLKKNLLTFLKEESV